MIDEWVGHVIVCGLHGVGLRTVEALNASGVRVVVVDDEPDPRLVRALAAWGVPHLVGSARLAETLQQAGLAGAVAVICVESDDLHTLEIALLARELRPDVRVVAQLGNQAVGAAMGAVLGAGSVLDVASLAAPSVVEACVGNSEHRLRVLDVDLVAAQVTVHANATLRILYGDLTPLAVERGGRGSQDVEVCPGRDLAVSRGDAVTLLGTPAELDAAGVVWGNARAHTAPPPQVLRPGRAWPDGMKPRQAGTGMVRYVLRLGLSVLERRLWIALSVLLGLVAVSTTVLYLGYEEADGTRMSVLDALYFTVETIGTVGYGDFYFRDQPAWLRVYAIGLMIFGAMLATVFFALLTNVLVSRRIEEQLGRRRVPGMSGHSVVIGVGAVGVGVVQGLLARGREVVVVERDETNRYLGQVRALGVPVVVGDATLADTLDAANVPGAGSVAVLTSDDLTNLETALAVRERLGERWRSTPVVVRLFDRQLALTVERSFAFHHVRSTAALAAPWFVGAALGLDVLGTFYVADTPLLLGRLAVTQDSGLVGLAMQDLGASIRVIGIDRGGAGALEHPPRRATTFAAGDVAYLVGPDEELLRVLRRDARSAPAAPPHSA